MARAPAFQEIEALPEADRLEGFPHPRETGALLGHEAAEAMLASRFCRRAHASCLAACGARRESARQRWPMAWRGTCWHDRRRGTHPGKGLAVPASSIAARQVAALSHPGLLVLRRPYDAQGKAVRQRYSGR